jgi:hypothetical protein
MMMKLKLGLAAALLVIAPVGFAGDPNPQIADDIAQIEARRNEKTAAEATAAQNRANEDGGTRGMRGGAPGGMNGGGGNRKRGNNNNGEKKN